MFWELFKVFFFSKRTESIIRVTSWLTFAGLFIGSFALVLVLSIMTGLGAALQETLFLKEAHLVVSESKLSKLQIQQEIANYSDDFKIKEFNRSDLLLERSDLSVFSGAQAIGYDSEGVANIIKNMLPAYHSLQEGKSLKPTEILLGRNLAQQLSTTEGPLVEGTWLTARPLKSLLMSAGTFIPTQRFKVAGILNESLSEGDNQSFYFSTGAIKYMSSFQFDRGFELNFSNPYKAFPLQKKLKTDLGISSESWKDRHQSLFLALKLEKYAMALFLGLSALITCFSMISLLILLLNQKRQTMGLLMAVGLSANKVRSLFFRLCLLLTGSGVFLGLFFGLIVSFIMERKPLKILPEHIYMDPYLYAKIDFKTLLPIILFCVTLCLLSSLVPLMRIRKLSPVSLIRKTN